MTGDGWTPGMERQARALAKRSGRRYEDVRREMLKRRGIARNALRPTGQRNELAGKMRPAKPGADITGVRG